MAKSSTHTPSASRDAYLAPPPTPFFPLARYTSLAGVHASLTLFAALFLPRTSLTELLQSFVTVGTSTPQGHHANKTAAPRSSNDRPASPLVQELSADPARTLAWLCVGALLLQFWWARWLARWAEEHRVSSLPEYAAKEERERAEAARLTRTGGSTVGREDAQKAGETAAWTGGMAAVYWGVIMLFGAPLTRCL
jgi:phosphatidylinositol glycan class F